MRKSNEVGFSQREISDEERRKAALAMTGAAARKKRWKHSTQVKESKTVIQALFGFEVYKLKRKEEGHDDDREG